MKWIHTHKLREQFLNCINKDIHPQKIDLKSTHTIFTNDTADSLWDIVGSLPEQTPASLAYWRLGEAFSIQFVFGTNRTWRLWIAVNKPGRGKFIKKQTDRHWSVTFPTVWLSVIGHFQVTPYPLLKDSDSTQILTAAKGGQDSWGSPRASPGQSWCSFANAIASAGTACGTHSGYSSSWWDVKKAFVWCLPRKLTDSYKEVVPVHTRSLRLPQSSCGLKAITQHTHNNRANRGTDLRNTAVMPHSQAGIQPCPFLHVTDWMAKYLAKYYSFILTTSRLNEPLHFSPRCHFTAF